MHAHNHQSSSRTLIWALIVTLGFAAVEALSGWLAHSLALLGDAGHMFTDASALGLAAFAGWLAQRPPSSHHSYGLVRAEVLAAIFNGLFMIVIVGGLIIAAIERLQHPGSVNGDTVIVIALIGLIVNIAVAWILHRGEQTLNTRAALLHVMGDLLGSVAALIAGVVIHFTAWYTIDPILSLLICVLILFSSLRLLREAIHVIMEGVPLGIELPEVGHAMAAEQGVTSVHDLHIWTLASGNIALSAHVVVEEINDWQAVLARLQQLLHDNFHVEHSTLQPEPADQIMVQDLPHRPLQDHHH
jgi:cobalt-zinc-cadmium efflux system protein